jgi:adhesin/invasin
VTGLGAVTPPVADGAAGAVNPLSIVIASVGVFVGEQNASVTFQGLAPGFAGVYQLNFVVPPGVPSGQVILSVSTPGALTSEAKLYIQ